MAFRARNFVYTNGARPRPSTSVQLGIFARQRADVHITNNVGNDRMVEIYKLY